MKRPPFDESAQTVTGVSARTFNLLKCEYAFEELDDGLPRIPLAAQRSLDASGVRLSVEAWRSLPAADQKIVMLAGGADVVDAQLIDSIVARATPSAVKVDKLVEPNRFDLPASVVEVLERSHPLDLERWAAASALDRYVLLRLRTDPEELARAYEEIFAAQVFPTQPRAGHSVMPAATDLVPKVPTLRRAVATARVQMRADLLSKLIEGKESADVLAISRTAGILAAKRASELIPLCASAQITRVDVTFAVDSPAAGPGALVLKARVEAFASGSLASDALVAASTAAITVVDMLRVSDRWMTISQVRVEEIGGGSEGDVRRP